MLGHHQENFKHIMNVFPTWKEHVLYKFPEYQSAPVIDANLLMDVETMRSYSGLDVHSEIIFFLKNNYMYIYICIYKAALQREGNDREKASISWATHCRLNH